MIDYEHIYRSFVKGQLHPFYSTMYAGLIRYAVRMLGDGLAYMAEDCVQDCVLNTYLHRHELATMERWRSWMLISIRNRAIEIMRRASTARAYEDSADRADMADDDITLSIIEQETLDEIFATVASLPERYREIFELSFEQGMKIADIARELGIAEITVKKRKARLIDILHRRLGDNAMLLVMSMSATCSV